jgi:SAM-dependent methyltransferase
MFDSRHLSASAALAAFGEALANGRKVLVLGSALSSLAELLLARGARLVHVCDPDPARALQAGARARSANLSFAAWGEPPLALREGAFDLAVIENLCAFEPTRTLREVRRLLGPRGVVLVASPNHDGPRPLLEPALESQAELDYYALYDAVAAEFRHVRMLGQAPFVGYAIAEFSPEGEVEPVIDTAFLERGSEEPDYFLALAAEHRASAEAYALVQLPRAEVLAESAPRNVEEELVRLRERERQHRKRIAELEAALSKAGRPGAATLSLEHKLQRQDAWIRELEARAATADARADAAELEIDELRKLLEAPLPEPDVGPTEREQELERKLAQVSSRLAEAEAKLSDAETKRAEAEAKLSDAETKRAEAKAKLSDAEAKLTATSAELARAEQKLAELLAEDASEPEDDLARLEQQLAERGREVRKLERELREAERLGRELLRKVSDPALARELAQARADQLAAVWTAEALRAQLVGAGVNRSS